MSARHPGLFLVIALLIATAVHAQSVVVGELSMQEFSTTAAPAGATVINLMQPVTGDGTLTTATIFWYGDAGCTGVRLRIFRSNAGSSNFTLVGERGPFTPGAIGYVTFALTPPISVIRGDLLGIYLPACGLIGGTYGSSRDLVLYTGTNYTGGPIPADANLDHNRFIARASSASPALAGIIPAVGATAGANGAVFRTTIQVHNPNGWNIKPQLVYHPAGSSAGSSDPSLLVPVGTYATTTLDFADAFHVTGLGSLDVLTAGDPPPVINARVYNDTPGGTNGFNEAMIPISAALHATETASITFPSDPANFRMNIGVRTLSGGASFKVSAVTNGSGSTLTSVPPKTYPPNFFEQRSLQDFLGGVAPPANGSLLIQFQGPPVGGDAIIYVSTTDNRTNDSAITVLTAR